MGFLVRREGTPNKALQLTGHANNGIARRNVNSRVSRQLSLVFGEEDITVSDPLPERGTSQGAEHRSLISALPSFPGEAVVAEKMAASVCDECEQPKAGTTSYTVLHIIFLVFFVVWRFDPVFKCPQCMRAYLLQRFPLSLLLATVFAPVVAVWWGVLFFRTIGR